MSVLFAGSEVGRVQRHDGLPAEERGPAAAMRERLTCLAMFIKPSMLHSMLCKLWEERRGQRANGPTPAEKPISSSYKPLYCQIIFNSGLHRHHETASPPSRFSGHHRRCTARELRSSVPELLARYSASHAAAPAPPP